MKTLMVKYNIAKIQQVLFLVATIITKQNIWQNSWFDRKLMIKKTH